MVAESMLVATMLPLETEIYSKSPNTMFYVVSGLMVPAVGISWIFRRCEQKKVNQLRRNLFRRNGGLILEKMQSRRRTLQLFTAEDLKRATNNYDENQILHREHHLGIVYKGTLSDQDNTMVTIRKVDAPDEWNSQSFIVKLVTLSQINHRNIVKLIGCCLETQVPLLVCEFFNAKTFYDGIHDDGLSWDICLNIALETARALAHMHSSTIQEPLIHGKLNSSNILLAHDYTAKVGFALTNSEVIGASFHVDEIWYLDPEYFISGQLTVKSDVYNFGVVLAELLTRKVISFDSMEGEVHLLEYFVSLYRGDDLLRIFDRRLVAEGNIEQLTEVAELAQRCLSHSSADRPTMAEVVIALENV